MHDTYQLQQTFEGEKGVQKTTFRRNDIAIINILTNDARTTKYRPPREFSHVSHYLTATLDCLLCQLDPKNIIVLESPPLLYEDIYPYAALAYRIARHKGVCFAPTIVGEMHLNRRDGVHVLKDFRRLSIQAIACAIAKVDPHQFLGLARPPFGIFGPWLAPFGRGMSPPDPSYSAVAASPPFHFRGHYRRKTIPNLMDLKIR